MRRDTEHKKSVQASLHRLMDGGMSLREISDLAEIDYQVLMNFSSKKMSIGAVPLRKLDEWLAGRVDSLGANTAPPVAVKESPPAFNGHDLSNDDSYIAIAVAQLHSTLLGEWRRNALLLAFSRAVAEVGPHQLPAPTAAAPRPAP